MNDVAKLQEENALLKELLLLEQEKVSERDNKIAHLQEQVRLFLARRFSPSSEKISPDQLHLFNEAEELAQEESEDVEDDVTESHSGTPKKTRKPRVAIPKAFPREEIVYDVNDDEKVCPHDGHALKNIGSDDHEQLDIIPAQIKVLLHRRLKYACPCCDKHIVTASKPKQAIEKSIASPGLLAFVATQKYCDAMPLYRQSESFKRIHIKLDRTNLANWMLRCGDLIQPLINRLQEHIQSQRLIHMDETTVQVLSEPGKPAQSKSYMWLMGHFEQQAAVIFHYSMSRSREIPLNLLDEDSRTLMVDGYEGYQAACDQYQVLRLGCWAHARRKFVDAQKLQKKGKVGRADKALSLIGKLYAIEKKIKDKPPDKRYEIRQKEAIPILNEMKRWLDKSLPNILPRSTIGKALTYLNNQWDRLVRYCKGGDYPIDNNAAERAIRPFTIGRKNWLFSKSQAGAKASANLYSLIETAKLNQLNPYDYLNLVFKNLPQAQGLEDIDKLLPWNVPIS